MAWIQDWRLPSVPPVFTRLPIAFTELDAMQT